MIWDTIKTPFFCSAPMANVVDVAFREMFAKHGPPDIFWTEFVSADGLLSDGKMNLLIDLKYTKIQRPIIAQLFTSDDEKMYQASVLCERLGFDGVDINMGCPDKSIEKSGSGAMLIKNRETAKKLIEAVKKTGMPVSVKTRLGYSEIDLDWIEFILRQDVKCLTIHLRTRKEMSNVEAHWGVMKEVIKIRDKTAPNTLIVGNGDIESIEQGLTMIAKYKCDGIMVGRGIFGNPWFFNKDKKPTEKERIEALMEHIELFDKHLGEDKNFHIIKKHFKAYLTGVSKGLRIKLMDTQNKEEAIKILKSYSV